MKILLKLCFQIVFVVGLFPVSGQGQVDCKNEQIELLELNLLPAFHAFVTIQIACDSTNMVLSVRTFKHREEVINKMIYKIPIELYKEFKATILPLDILSMKEHVNLYMLDGLETEITFLDRFGNFNKFKTRLPMSESRNLFLIETIISLVEKLEIDRGHRDYLKKIRGFYMK